MVAVGVRAARVVPNTKPRAPPTSNPSTCHPLPTVYASPRVRALPCPASGVDKLTRAVNIVTMDRRTFVLLTGAGSAALIRPPNRLSLGPPRADGGTCGRAEGRLRFEL